MTIERKMGGVMVPFALSVIDPATDRLATPTSELGCLVGQELTGFLAYDNIQKVLKECNGDGEFEYENQRGRVLAINFIRADPGFAGVKEKIEYKNKLRTHSQERLLWGEYNAIGRPASIVVEERTMIVPNKEYRF